MNQPVQVYEGTGFQPILQMTAEFKQFIQTFPGREVLQLDIKCRGYDNSDTLAGWILRIINPTDMWCKQFAFWQRILWELPTHGHESWIACPGISVNNKRLLQRIYFTHFAFSENQDTVNIHYYSLEQ